MPSVGVFGYYTGWGFCNFFAGTILGENSSFAKSQIG